MNSRVVSTNRYNIEKINQGQTHLLALQMRMTIDLFDLEAQSDGDGNKKKKRKKQIVQPTDTRGIIPQEVMDVLKGYSRLIPLTLRDSSAEFTLEERPLVLSYFINMFYLGFDEGRYSVIYSDGEISSVETTREKGKSNTEGSEIGGGISAGKEPGVNLSGKLSESHTKNSGSSSKIISGAEIYNQLKVFGNNLAAQLQQLIVKTDRKERVCFSKDAVVMKYKKGMFKGTVIDIEDHYKKYGRLAREQGKESGKNVATTTNVR